MTQQRFKLLIDDYNWSFALLVSDGGVWHPSIHFQGIHMLADFVRVLSSNLNDMANMAEVLTQGLKCYQEVAVPKGMIWNYVNDLEVLDTIGKTK